MNVFEAVKQSVTTRQAAEHYGIRVGRNGMCVCPFHDDKNPSMKVDRRFHCFGCQADGDVIDFVSHLENVSPKEAALMLAQDFSIPYEDKEPPSRSRRPQPRQESPELHAFQACLFNHSSTSPCSGRKSKGSFWNYQMFGQIILKVRSSNQCRNGLSTLNKTYLSLP